MKIYFISILLCFCCVFLSSCDRGILIHQYAQTNEKSWNMKECLHYSLYVEDTMEKYDFMLNIRHNEEYPYMNLFLFVKTIFPDHRFSVDTVECLMANYEGKWLGKGWGKYKTAKYLMKKGIRFPESGNYSFEIYQGMREENLRGIHSIGIKIENQ